MATKLVLAAFLFLLPLNSLAQENVSERYIFFFYGVPYSFTYPAGWVTSEALGQVVLTNSEEARSRTLSGEELGPGDLYIYVAASEMLFFYWDVFEPVTELKDMADLVRTEMSNELVFGQAQDAELSDGSRVLTATGTARDGGHVAAFVVKEYDEGRFLVFFASASEGSTDSLVRLLMDMAASLETGSEVSLESATLSDVKTVELEEGIYPVAFTDDRIYAIEVCSQCSGNLLTLSLEGKELARFDSKNLQWTPNVRVLPAENGSFWVIHHSATEESAYAVSLLSAEGDVERSIDLEESYVPQIMQVDSKGNLYLALTYQIVPAVTQPPYEVTRNSTETWIQVWDMDGALLREFQITYDEYTIRSGVDAMAIGPDDNLYFIDANSIRGIMVFDTQGNAVREGFAQGSVMFQTITGFDVMPDGTLFLGISAGSPGDLTYYILHLSAEGELQGVFTAENLGLDTLYMPRQFSMKDNGDVVVTGIGREGVQTFQMTITPPLSS